MTSPARPAAALSDSQLDRVKEILLGQAVGDTMEALDIPYHEKVVFTLYQGYKPLLKVIAVIPYRGGGAKRVHAIFFSAGMGGA